MVLRRAGWASRRYGIEVLTNQDKPPHAGRINAKENEDMIWVEMRFTPEEREMLAADMADVRSAAPDALKNATDECVGEMASLLGMSVFGDEGWARRMKTIAEEDRIHLIADKCCALDEFRAVGMYFADIMFPELPDDVARYLDYEQIGMDLAVEYHLFVDAGEDGVLRMYWLDI